MSKRFLILLYIQCLSIFVVRSQYFSEVGEKFGLSYIYPGNDYQEVGSGVTIIDVNNDGWEDMFQSGGVFPSKLWINVKGVFKDSTHFFGLDCLNSIYIQGTVAGDVNNDGYEDLFICNYGKGMRMGDDHNPVLLLNKLGKGFEPAFVEDFNLPGNYTSCAFGDYNKDSYIDLYVTDYVSVMYNYYDTLLDIKYGYDPRCKPNKFYLNKEGKSFEEIALKMGIANNGCGLAATFSDFDNDDDVDILLLNDFGEWNHLGNQFYRNDYPLDHFTEISDSIRFYAEIYGMGIGPGDYDNDGDLDYYVTNIGQNLFYENDGGTFIEKGKTLGIDNTFVNDTLRGSSWSGIFLDIENDGDLDLYVAKGNLKNLTPPTVINDPNKLFLNLGNKNFKDISDSSGLNDILSHRGAATIDFDHDGDLDIISSVIKMSWASFGNQDQKIKLFRNEQESKNNWIGIQLVGTEGTNYSCIGCSAEAETSCGKQMREVDGGTGHGSQSSKILYFGLGKDKRLNKLNIQWLGSASTSVLNIKAGHVYRISKKGVLKKVY